MKEITFCGCRMHAMTMSETIHVVQSRIREQTFTQHSVVNVAKLVNMSTNLSLKTAVEDCDIINIDGMGVVLGARFHGFDIPERVTGIDLFFGLVELAEREGFPVYFLGAADGVVKETVNTLQEQYPSLVVAGSQHGYFSDDEQVAHAIKNSGARLLFVAMTSPKKEMFINRWKDQLGVDFVMGVGGTFDIVAGKTSRAPLWMQKYGFEWLYRLLQEPRRMWKRYLLTNLRFAAMIFGKYRS